MPQIVMFILLAPVLLSISQLLSLPFLPASKLQHCQLRAVSVGHYHEACFLDTRPPYVTLSGPSHIHMSGNADMPVCCHDEYSIQPEEKIVTAISNFFLCTFSYINKALINCDVKKTFASKAIKVT